jgi:hypothetical protein
MNNPTEVKMRYSAALERTDARQYQLVDLRAVICGQTVKLMGVE